MTAVREVEEETGVTIRLNSPLDSVRYPTTAGLKAVDWWIGSAVSVVRRAPDAEVDAVAWLPLRSAMSRLTFPHDHALVEQCIQQPETTPLILVRHAKAMDRKDWSKSKKDASRPLNSRAPGGPAGDRLCCRLRCATPGQLGGDPLLSTLTPYATKAGSKIEKHDELSEDAGRAKPRPVADIVRTVPTMPSAPRSRRRSACTGRCSRHLGGAGPRPGQPRHRRDAGRPRHGRRGGTRRRAPPHPRLSSPARLQLLRRWGRCGLRPGSVLGHSGPERPRGECWRALVRCR